MNTQKLRGLVAAVEKGTSLGLVALMGMLSYLVLPVTASAAELTGESASLSDPTISGTGNYTLTLAGVSATLIKCITVNFTTAVAGTTLPTGMVITPAAITPSGTIGAIGAWTESNPNAYTYQITNTTGVTPAGGAATVVLSGITNSSVANTTYYATVNTFSDATCTTPVDVNGISTFVNTAGVQVSATVNPTLTFTVDSTTCNLGTLTAATTGKCSHTMTAASNATTGYAISYIPSATLTSGANTITANGGTALANATGGEQFGLNLVANTSPVIGAAASGGTGAAAANYSTANSFAFDTAGATVATTSIASLLTTFTVSYIANIDAVTQAGAYTKTQTYNITATY